MSKQPSSPDRGQARTQTIAVAATAMETLLNRKDGVPGFAALSGPPGYGKTSAAVFLSHPADYNCVYVSCRSFETTKSLAQMLLKELGVAAKTHWPISTAFDHICESLVQSGRPLVVDEVDHIAEKTTVNLLRDIHDTVFTPIFMIGEGMLKQKLLNHHERLHDRVLVWGQAVPADGADLDKLMRHYAPDLQVDAAGKRLILQMTAGVARRIVYALSALGEAAVATGALHLGPAEVSAALRGMR